MSISVVFSLLAIALATPALTVATASDGQTRIIDGDFSTPTAAPFMVSMSLTPLVHSHTCAGTIIGKDWVLTAAHCLDKLKAHNGDVVGLPVYAGQPNRTQSSGAQVRTIDFAFQHKEFTGEEGSEDIALLHVQPPFQFDEHVQQAVLPYRYENFTGVDGVVYGWGLTEADDNHYATSLRYGMGTVLSAAHCADLLPKDAPLHNPAKTVCARVPVCFGDGGSPLVVKRAGPVAELVGVTSWGFLPCGHNNRPNVFTSVSQYIDWISQVQWAYYTLH